METIRQSIIVSGRVQGVGFRFHTRGCARRHHITGWVRNRTDGSVKIEAQGGGKEMAAFRSDIEKGPPLSLVQKCTVADLPTLSGETGFTIRF